MAGLSASFSMNYGQCMKALANARPPSLAPLPIQYADFAAWQKEWLNSSESRRASELLAEAARRPTQSPRLFPPTAPAGPENDLPTEGLNLFAVPADLTEALKKLSKSEGVTMFTLDAGLPLRSLSSAVQIRRNMVIGSPVANSQNGDRTAHWTLLPARFPFRFDLSDNPHAA